MDPDQPAHPRSLTRIHAVRLPTLLQVEKLIANSMDPDQNFWYSDTPAHYKEKIKEKLADKKYSRWLGIMFYK
jgi:hypothetical protein